MDLVWISNVHWIKSGLIITWIVSVIHVVTKFYNCSKLPRSNRSAAKH